LQSISTFGVDSALVDPTGTNLAFKISSQSAVKNGIYVLNMVNRSFPVLAGQGGSTQIVNDTLDNFSTANLTWSPDGTQLLADVSNSTTGQETDYLLNINSFNGSPQDVTATMPSLLADWKAQRQDKEQARIKSLKSGLRKYVNSNFRILAWSPDENKILYQASTSGQIPIFIKPRRIGNNLLYEQRTIQQGGVYVYDIPEDLNFRITNSIPNVCDISVSDCVSNPFTWFPDSTHLLYVHDFKITIVEQDGSNSVTIYAGPFVDNYVYPWPDGSKIVILTNLDNPTVNPTLYTISLR
jgi:Tol biopolymer transport system component